MVKMSSGNYNNQDFAALKNLLSSWHLEILFNLFKEEDIAIEELKMMQLYHISSLLKNCKMGVRIRFEYNFINWRNKIGIPLSGNEANRCHACCCYSNNPVCENKIEESFDNNIDVEPTAKKRKVKHQDLLVNIEPVEIGNTQLLLSPHGTKSEKFLNKIETCTEATLTPENSLGSINQQTNHTDEEGEDENCTLSSLRDFQITTLEEEAPNFSFKHVPDKCPASLRQILELSGKKGMSILNFYEEHHRLTCVQRSQLIQIIVDFFDINDYNISLYMSHNLEWEILRMFPTEKLEYYRTKKKRFKIYIKYVNTKRCRRERNNKSKTETDITNSRSRRLANPKHQIDGFTIDNNGIVDNDDDNDADWPVDAETEIQVKEENLESI